MSVSQLKLGPAPVDVGGPRQQSTRPSPEIPGDPSVKIERARQLKAAGLDFVFIVLNRLEPLTLLSALVASTTNGDSGTAGNHRRHVTLARGQEEIHPAKDFAKTLAELGRAFGRLDFSQYDLDAPFPAEAVKYGQNSVRTQAEKIARVAREESLSLRETVLYFERWILNPSPAPPRRSPTKIDC
jgi:hypothetical protein